jgi:hypothetical protein
METPNVPYPSGRYQKMIKESSIRLTQAFIIATVRQLFHFQRKEHRAANNNNHL